MGIRDVFLEAASRRDERVSQDILKFKMALVRKMPFYGDIVIKLPIVQDNGIPTACTNGKYIKYNSAFFDTLNEGQKNFVIMHEVLHILLFHWLRKRDFNPQLWNVACDYIVNDMLNKMNFREVGIKLERPPKGCFLNYLGNSSAEDIYYKLLENNQNYCGKDIIIVPKNFIWNRTTEKLSIGSILDIGNPDWMDELSEEEKMELKKQISRMITESCERNRSSIGSFYVQREILKMVESRTIPWKRLMMSFLQESLSEESSYLTPERKYIHMDLIVPGPEMSEDILGELWAFVDSSGSVRQEELNQFLTQLYRIAKEFQCILNIAYWDTQVTDVYKNIRRPRNILECQPRHSGGTDINCVYQYIEENHIKPEAMVIMTDGYYGHLVKPVPNKLRRKTILLLTENQPDLELFKEVGRVTKL